MSPAVFGTYIGMGLVAGFIIWLIWALIKYKPFSHIVQFAYDMRKFAIQIVLMYSNKHSIFSIKRFHNGLITYWAVITASLYIRHQPTLSPQGLVMIMLPLLAIGGYNIYQTQQDKKIKINEDLTDKIVDKTSDFVNKIQDDSSDLANKIADKPNG